MINEFEIAELDPFRTEKKGSNLRLEFPLKNFPDHICRVFKRYRNESSDSVGVVRDWVITVEQRYTGKDGKTETLSQDQLVIRRIPCALQDLEVCLQNNIGINHNKRTVPKTMLHIFLNCIDITVYSQKFHDLSQQRFDY